MTAPPPPHADALACAAAGRYAGRWARGAAAGAAEQTGPWFVEGFAGADLQRAALRSVEPAPGAIAAVRALDDASGGRARVVLVEEDPGLVVRLAEQVERIGAGDRLRLARDPASAAPGEILLVEAPFTAVAAGLAEAIGDGPALVRLAPLTARALPWSALRPVAALRGAEVLLRLPHEDFAKQGRFGGPLADLPPHLRRVVEGCSAFLDDPRHAWLAAWREAQRTGGEDAALAGVVERLRTLLTGGDEERLTHVARIEGDGGAVHLLLSTAEAEHAAELDRSLSEDGETAQTAALAPPAAAAADEPSAALELFPTAAPEAVPRGLDLRALAGELHARHAGGVVAMRDVVAGSGHAPEQVRAALAALKRTGRASYRSLDADDAAIEFLADPRPAKPKPRPPRPGELGLFDDPES